MNRKYNLQDRKLLAKLMQEASACYISANNHICYRHHANLDYYNMICNKLKLNIKCISGGLSYEATKAGANYSIDWVEHDLILAFNQVGIRKDFIFKNNKDVLIKLHIDTTHIITSDTFEAIKDMILKDRLFIYEYERIRACDDYIYNTNYFMSDIEFIPTFTEDESGSEKIIQIDIFFNVKQNDDMKVRRFDESTHKQKSILFNAITQ